jgi:CheY-like chemotaxis protein
VSPLPVLVVDDDAQVRRLIHSVLAKRGLPILEAEDGASALAVLRGLHGAVGLVATDYSMPNLNGAALAERVINEFPAVPVLLLSSREAEIDGISAVGDAFLAKPFEPATLVATVARLYGAPTKRQCA